MKHIFAVGPGSISKPNNKAPVNLSARSQPLLALHLRHFSTAAYQRSTVCAYFLSNLYHGHRTYSVVHGSNITQYHPEHFRHLQRIIDITRSSLVNSRSIQQQCLCVVRNRRVFRYELLTDSEDDRIRTYFENHFPEIHLQHLPINQDGKVHRNTWNDQTIFINYELAYAVSTARSYPCHDTYDNAALLFITTLLHECAHTLGTHIHNGGDTSLELRDRGFTVESTVWWLLGS